jgi:hypothetical protein
MSLLRFGVNRREFGVLRWLCKVPRCRFRPEVDEGFSSEGSAEIGGREVLSVYRFIRSSADDVARMRFLVLGADGEMVRVRRGEVCALKRNVSEKVAGREISVVLLEAGSAGIEAMKP